MRFRTERILIVSALLLVGIMITQALVRGASSSVAVWGWPLIVWLLALALALTAAVGSVWLRQGAAVVVARADSGPPAPLRGVKRLASWDIVVPVLLVLGALVFVQLFQSGTAQALVVALTALAFAALYWAQAHTVSTTDRYFSLAQSALNVISHLVAFLMFSVLYGLKTRALFSATAAGVVAALLLYELLVRDINWRRSLGLPVEGRPSGPRLLALAGGLVTAQLMWGLNYWAALTTLMGGAFLLLVFYVLHGLASHYIERKLDRRIMVEFGSVGALGVLVILVTAFVS